MFDWDDEDLTHMIWDDDGETGDHIVPFKVRCEQRNKKEESNESNKAVKPAEQTKTSLHDHDGKLGSSSGHNIDKRIPNPDSSLSHAREAVPGSSATDESKEQGDYDEWANIGTFDDLDRMFSNDVPIFGGADELCSSSSKDVSNNTPSKQLLSVLDSQDLGLDIREQQVNQQFPLSVPSVGVTSKHEQYHEYKGQPSAENQTYQKTKMINFSEMSGASKAGGAFHDPYDRRKLYRNSPGNFVNQLAPSQTSLMAINLQKSEESQGSGTSHYPHLPNQYNSGFGNPTNPYSSEVLQRPDVKNQLMHPSYYNPATAISLNMVTDASTRTMTPQEKLEKLRRRQQIQAMLAIQRQQQQFRHQVQVPVADQSIIQNYCQDNPLQLVDKAKLQGLTAMPSFDHSSSLEPGDFGNFAAAAAAVDNSSEFSVLYRLQGVVAKLETGTRTCIRDSLFRLADSASQRHHTSDKTSREVTPKEKSTFRYGGMLDTETVTNPTDRTVAHLLFHRPFDMSAAKHMEGGLESPVSSKMGIEVKEKFPKCNTRESHINKQKAKEEEILAGSLALGNAPNSGSSSTVGEASQGNNKRKL